MIQKMMSASALALCVASPAFAANVLIDFEAVTSFASVAEFYNGGSDSAGASGPALGVSFGGDALAFANDELGPYFSHAPSPLGVMAPVGAEATMNVATGFTGTVSVWYAATGFVAQGVNVWSGLDGSGKLLASFNLVDNASNGCSDSPFCHFDQLSASFHGVAKSITFGNGAGVAAFDNIAISAVPEPTAALLMSLGLAGLMLVRRRG